MITNKRGRPSKEGSNLKLKSANWRLVIPNLQQYKDASFQEFFQLKCSTLQLLKQRQKKYHLRYYHVALQHHANGVPHLDILLIYDKSIQHKLNHFDYLLKHGNITTYRKLNQAILDYGRKEDKDALSNVPQETKEITVAHQDGSITKERVNVLLQVQELKKDPYRYLELQMLRDPLHFNLQQYVRLNDLAKDISSWSSIKTKIKDMQVAAANLKLRDKPGFKVIDRALIQSTLSPSELKVYDSWDGYQTIVNKFNQVVDYKTTRPFKTKQLLLVGSPNIGKTSLVRAIQEFTSIYHMDVSNWFPLYRNGVYSIIFWDQFKLKGGMSHTDLLKFLQGSPMDLQYKGGSTLRNQNQLIIMTSNMSLRQHINLKFKEQQQRALAFQNLSTRIQQLCIPKHLDLFFLIKLLISNN